MRIMILRKVPKVKIRRKDNRCTKATSRHLLHKDSMDIVLIAKSLDIEQVNADPNKTRHLTSLVTHQEMVILMIGTITQGIVATTIKNMDMFLKIV